MDPTRSYLTCAQALILYDRSSKAVNDVCRLSTHLASTQNEYLAMSGSISEELIHAKDNYNRALQAARAVADSMQIEAEPPLTPISLSHKWALFDREAVRSQHESDLRI
eukprot:CAMPEP_0181207590 /NCGR_PEP_ID=MMETSP1096-20121128/21664_1 /TAXON_ID=156174 ORGANISM="Chrysochromulina ericina, Strain CCMP281" /NCGR_SAMPLE_ID=MMETSP1096 /ASSEMBLY_ACC=CAM_ASM_000453 /LENGTH=108 /DNA_ID=CAMNT_0023298595 /DNA_START=113 /DNA_END=439 /DNA_ORIENTATION=+